MAVNIDQHQHSEPEIKNEKEYAREVLQDLKRQRIREACKARDLPKLGALALSTEGFISDDLRGLACKSSTTSYRMHTSRILALSFFEISLFNMSP